MITANVVTKNQNKSDLLIPITLTESVYSCKSKYTNTKNNDNKQDITSTHIYTIKRQYLQKNRKIGI